MRKARPAEVELLNGELVDLLNPDLTWVTINSLAEQMLFITRHNGCTVVPVSLLQHSLWVEEALHTEEPLVRLYGLVHDMHECLVGDMTSPVKQALRAVDCNGYADLERMAELAPPKKAFRDLVKYADIAVLNGERKRYRVPSGHVWGTEDVPAAKLSTPNSSPIRAYMRRLELLFGLCKLPLPRWFGDEPTPAEMVTRKQARWAEAML
jgi:hypothetical protein